MSAWQKIKCQWFGQHTLVLKHEESVPPQWISKIEKNYLINNNPWQYLCAINGFTYKIYKCQYCEAVKTEARENGKNA